MHLECGSARGCCRQAEVPRHVDLSIEPLGVLTTWRLASPRAGGLRNSKAEAQVSELTRCYFRLTLFITSESLSASSGEGS